MRKDIVLLEVTVQIRLLISSLLLELFGVASLTAVECISEELHIGSCSSDVLFYFLPNHIIKEILIPEALFLYTKRMIVFVIFVVVFRMVHIWDDNEICP